MISLGATGGSSEDASMKALTDLLAVVSDPKAAQARLKTLEAKGAGIQADLEKVVALNLQIEETKKGIETAQAKLDETIAGQATKEADLQSRESKLTEAQANLSSSSAAFSVEKTNFDNVSALKDDELQKRSAVLAKAEKDHTARVQSTLAEMDKILADRLSKLEAAHKDKLDSASALNDEALKKRDAAVKALAEAEAQKKNYENQVAAIQQVIQGNSK